MIGGEAVASAPVAPVEQEPRNPREVQDETQRGEYEVQQVGFVEMVQEEHVRIDDVEKEIIEVIKGKFIGERVINRALAGGVDEN